MNVEILRVLYPPRFSRAILRAGARGVDRQIVDLTALGRDALEFQESGLYLAAADDSESSTSDGSDNSGSDDDESEEMVEEATSVALVKRLSRVEAAHLNDGTLASRKTLLKTLVENSGARELKPLFEPSYDFAGHMHQTTEVVWRQEQVMAIEEIQRQSPTVAACIETLRNQVMRDGIKFLRGNVELVPSADFAEFKQSRFEPFAAQCLLALLQIGIVPIVYEWDPVTGQRWPYVPALGTYSIRMYRVRGATRYRFFWIDEQAYRYSWHRQAVRVPDRRGAVEWVPRSSMGACGELGDGGGIEDPTVEILHNLGHDLAADGSINSKCASALGIVRESAYAARNRTIADTLSAMPPIATEYNHAAEAQQARNLQQGYYVGSLSAPADTQLAGDLLTAGGLGDSTYVRDVGAQQALAASLRNIEAQSGRDVSNEFGIPRASYTADIGGTSAVQPSARVLGQVPAPYSSQYHVTASRQLVPLPQARMAGDYVAYIEQQDRRICALFGVPKTIIDGDAIKAGTDLATQRLGQEVAALRRLISDILTHVYNTLFLAADTDRLASVVDNRKRALQISDSASLQHALLTEEEFFVAEAIRRVKVTFAKPPAETTEQLKELFGFGALDQEGLCKELLRNAGFEAEQSCAIKRKLPEEARLFMVPELAAYAQHKAQKQQAEEAASLARETAAAAAAGGGGAAKPSAKRKKPAPSKKKVKR